MIRSRAAFVSVGAAATLFLGAMPAVAPVAGAAAATTPASSSALFIPGPHGVHPATASAGSSTTETSENWSGYIDSGSEGAYTSSTASWTVPTVSTADNGYSSTWVGIDGASSGDGYLIQTGTEADVVDGQTNYDAWWEVITPSDEAPETLYSGLAISPGDSITASVSQGSGGDWTMTLTDETTGQTGTETTAYAGPGESAEWIQEDTDVDNEISTAPDWGSVTFDGITTDGGNPDLSGGDAVNIVDSQGTQEDSTSAPNGTDDGFTVTWQATGTETPV